MVKIAKCVVLLLVMLLTFSTTSCISEKKITYLQGADTLYSSPRNIDQEFELTIQPDDELAISVTSKDKALIEPFNNNTLIGSGSTSSSSTISGIAYYLVDKQGNIFLPIFGAISTKGKTCRQLAEELQQKFVSGNYIRDAVVNCKIMSFKVTVLGDVANPGTQTFTGERLSLLEAIGRAGDLNSSAKREHVLVVREENGKRTTYEIDLRDPQSVFNSPAYYLQQNDMVYVQPNKSVRVKGSTGYMLLSVGSTVLGMLLSVASFVIALKK